MGQTVNDMADPGGFWHKNENKQPDMPPQPDYVGAARTQAGGSIGTAVANALMGQNNVISPVGTQTWNQVGNSTINVPGLGDINIPRFQQNIQLSPEQQQLYEGQTALQGGLLQDFSTNRNNPVNLQDQAYAAQTARLDPQWEQREQAQKTQLANQGLAPGGEAYTNAMRDFNAARNDAYTQARMAAIQTIPTEIALRDVPLNELNALRTGSPVSMPQFQQGVPGSAQGPQTLNALGQQSSWEQAMYNAQVQQANQRQQGLMGLGGAALMAFL